uniref:Uncharacterized protein n=1 Tax=Tanacetum cinerariifolium TaxID=118510 RepID=A0A699UJZ4_TANCI|nr:hypothetical protein [Tanacetum cinerariifolium]
MTVLEELDKLKAGKHSVAAECRQAIRRFQGLSVHPDEQARRAQQPSARASERQHHHQSTDRSACAQKGHAHRAGHQRHQHAPEGARLRYCG